MSQKSGAYIPRERKHARERRCDSHPLVAPFSPITPRKSRARAGSNVGSEREGRDTLGEERRRRRENTPRFLRVVADGHRRIDRREVTGESAFNLLGNKELARWVRMNLFAEHEVRGEFIEPRSRKRSRSEKGQQQQQQQQQQLLFCPFREETSEKARLPKRRMRT